MDTKQDLSSLQDTVTPVEPGTELSKQLPDLNDLCMAFSGKLDVSEESYDGIEGQFQESFCSVESLNPFYSDPLSAVIPTRSAAVRLCDFMRDQY